MRLTANSLLVTGTSVLASVISYIFNPLLIAPYVGPSGIAVLGTFLSLNYLLAFPQRPIAMLITQSAVWLQSQNRPDLIREMILRHIRIITIATVPLIAMTYFGAKSVAVFLHLDSFLPVTGAVLLSILGLFMTVLWLPLQSLLRFKRYSLVFIIDPIVRLLIGTFLAFAGWKVLGAIIGYLAGCAAATLLALTFMSDIFKISKPLNGADRPYAFPGSTMTVWGLSAFFALVFSIDGLLVKRFFPADSAGIYMASTSLARLVLILVMPICGTSFTYMCHETSQNLSPNLTLFKTISFILAVCLPLILVSFIWADKIILLTYQAQFLNAAPILPYSFFSLMLISVIFALTGYWVASGHRLFLIGLFIGLVFEILLLTRYHTTLKTCVISVAVANLFQLFLALTFSIPDLFRKRMIAYNQRLR